MRILIGILLYSVLSLQAAHAEIEIISAGRKFDSFADYQKIEKKKALLMEQLAQGKEPAEPAAPPDPDQQKMTNASYNQGVHRVVVKFDQNWENPKPRFIIGSEELEYSIQEAMENQHQPTLLISDSKKLRIMSYAPQIAQANTVDKTIKK
jgi:hypothetical protein